VRQSGGRQQLLVPGWQMQSLDQSQHPRRQLVSDSGGWLPRTSLLDQLQNAAAAAATRALVSVAVCSTFVNPQRSLLPLWVQL